MANEFLMRRIIYSPDSVKIRCDIPIRVLQEIYFNSIVNLPKVLFKQNQFIAKVLEDEYIELSLLQWSKFQLELVELFNQNDNEKIINSMFNELNQLSKTVESCMNKDIITHEDFYKLVNGMALVDSYAVFNMFLPVNSFKSKLQVVSPKIRIEDIMICAFNPHRVLIRKKKLEMAVHFMENGCIDSELSEYFRNFVFYEEFENWLFFPEKYKSSKFLLREIKGLCDNHSIEELKEQLLIIDKKRDDAINRARQFANDIPDLKQFLILPAIITEEEKRHMIECKLLFCIGKSLEKLHIDIARSDIETIARAIQRRQVYGE